MVESRVLCADVLTANIINLSSFRGGSMLYSTLFFSAQRICSCHRRAANFRRQQTLLLRTRCTLTRDRCVRARRVLVGMAGPFHTVHRLAPSSPLLAKVNQPFAS